MPNFAQTSTNLVQFFKTQRNYGGVSLLILLLLIQVSRFLQLFVGGYEFQLLSLDFSLLSFVVNTAVIFGCGFLLNNIANRYQLFEVPSNLPAAVFFAFCAFIPFNQNIDTWLIVLMFSILILNKLAKAYQRERAGRNYFDSAFLVMILCFLFPQYAILLVALFFATFILSIPSLANLQMILVGAAISFLLLLSVLYVSGSSAWVDGIVTSATDSFTNFRAISFRSFLLPTVFLAVLFLVSYLFWQVRKPFLAHYQKPILRLSTLLLFAVMIMVVLFLDWQLVSFIGGFFALALLVSFFLFYNKSFLANVLFIIIIGYAIAYPWIKDLNLSL